MKKIIKTIVLVGLLNAQLGAFSINKLRTGRDSMRQTTDIQTGLNIMAKALSDEISIITPKTAFGKTDFYKEIFAPIRSFINRNGQKIVGSDLIGKYSETTAIVNRFVNNIKETIANKENIKSINQLVMPFHVLVYWLSEDGYYLGEETAQILEGLKTVISRLNEEIAEKEYTISTLESDTTSQDEILRLENELVKLKAESDQVLILTKEIDAIKETRDELLLQNKALNTQINQLSDENIALQDKILEIQATERTLNETIDRLKTAQRELEETIISLNDRIEGQGVALESKDEALANYNTTVDALLLLLENAEKEITIKDDIIVEQDKEITSKSTTISRNRASRLRKVAITGLALTYAAGLDLMTNVCNPDLGCTNPVTAHGGNILETGAILAVGGMAVESGLTWITNIFTKKD